MHTPPTDHTTPCSHVPRPSVVLGPVVVAAPVNVTASVPSFVGDNVNITIRWQPPDQTWNANGGTSVVDEYMLSIPGESPIFLFGVSAYSYCRHGTVCLSFVSLSLYPHACPFVHLFILFYVHLSVCLSVRPSIHPSVCLFLCPRIHLSICLSFCLSVCLCVRPSIHPSVCLSLCSSVCLSVL